jgi:putative Mg2+ transporter-C (MgtC) family protein
MMSYSYQLTVLGEVSLAMLLGGLIGLEREISDKPAGLRTHMLVAATSTLLVSLSNALVQVFNEQGAELNADPIRVVQAIVIGIGFLGAGTISQRPDRERIEGLTTGASLLLAAALGICVAARQWLIASGTTLIALAIMVLLGRWEHRDRSKNKKQKERA